MSKITTISNLFDQAASEEQGGNPEAAKTFTEKALQLCEKHGISEAEARSHMSEDEKANTMTVLTVPVGEARSHGLLSTANYIAATIENVIGAKVNIRHNGTNILVYGTMDQAERAQELVKHLLEQVNYSLAAGKKSYKKNPIMDWSGKPLRFSAGAFRIGFFEAVYRISEDIRDARDKNIREAQNNESSMSDSERSSALAVRELGLEVLDFYKEKSRARGTLRSSSTRGAGFAQGRESGAKASLSTQKALSA